MLGLLASWSATTRSRYSSHRAVGGDDIGALTPPEGTKVDLTRKVAKVAVLLSGSMRTLDSCTGSMKRHVVEANAAAAFDFYAYLTVDDDADRAAIQKSVEEELSGLSAAPPKVTIVTEGEAASAVNEALPKLSEVPEGRGTAQGKASNIAQMFYGIAGAANLLYEATKVVTGVDGHACHSQSDLISDAALQLGETYDLVMRVRPDLYFCAPLLLTGPLNGALQAKLVPGAPEAGVVYVPWFASPSQATVLAPDQEETGTCNLAFDQIAVGRPGPMVQYLDGFGTTVCEEVAAKHELYPERVMGTHLRRVPLRRLWGFNASLARGGGDEEVTYDSPFMKLDADAEEDADAGLECLKDAHPRPDYYAECVPTLARHRK